MAMSPLVMMVHYVAIVHASAVAVAVAAIKTVSQPFV